MHENLKISGIDVAALAETYGTPLVVMNENVIRDNMRTYKNSIDEHYDGKGLCAYASKAFSCVALIKIAKEEGLGVDVISEGELLTALKAGMPAERILFHGNSKTEAEITAALKNNIRRIVIDNKEELARVSKIAQSLGVVAKCLVRITPGIEAHTHDFVLTGNIDSKFGTPVENGAALDFIGEIIADKNIELFGLHCHIGSQIFELTPFVTAAEKLLSLMLEVRGKYGKILSELNLGGGFGIKYVESDDPINFGRYIETVSISVKKICGENDFPLPFIYMEPGRSIVGNAGTTLYTVSAVKEIPGVRNYVLVDGGMTDNPRYALYKSEYSVAVATKQGESKDFVATIGGRCCESGDIIAAEVAIEKPQAGDILAVFDTGAYNYSMALNYNRAARPAVIFAADGKSRIAIRRETPEDVVALDILD